jgi:hypothetical protein
MITPKDRDYLLAAFKVEVISDLIATTLGQKVPFPRPNPELPAEKEYRMLGEIIAKLIRTRLKETIEAINQKPSKRS